VDKTHGHPTAGATVFTEGSPNVFCNNLPVVRKGDPIEPHGLTQHNGKAEGNTLGIFCNNLPIQLVGDKVDCGDVSEEGSPDVICGE
jgi:uncharacterized Zn-binding protein involved in type VI secretion